MNSARDKLLDLSLTRAFEKPLRLPSKRMLELAALLDKALREKALREKKPSPDKSSRCTED